MVRVLFYAINGSGLGHLTRLLAIARSLRELLEAMELRSDLRFLTTSEASGAAWDFPTYKLPSNTVVAAAGVDRNRFMAESRLLAINLVASLAPDILVTDTLPQGAFGEIAVLRGHAKAAVYIDRHKDPSISDSELHRQHLPLYERILVPDDEDQAERYPLSGELAGRRRFVGSVQGFRPERAWTRQRVREYFAIPEGKRLVFIGAGGGGDVASRNGLLQLVEALSADPSLHLLVGFGPLHQGQCLYRENLTPLQELDVSRYFYGLDGAVSAAGYNSYQELLAARVPTVFFAQPKGMDRQDERIGIGLERNWHSSFNIEEPGQILNRVQEILDGELKSTILQALGGRPWAHGAIRAATEILALHSTQAGSPVQRGILYQTALQRQAEPALEGFIEAAKTVRVWRRVALLPSALAEREEAARSCWRQSDDTTLAGLGRELLWGARLAQLPEPLKLARAWCYQGPGDEEQERQARLQLEEALDQGAGPELSELRIRFKGPHLRVAASNLQKEQVG